MTLEEIMKYGVESVTDYKGFVFCPIHKVWKCTYCKDAPYSWTPPKEESER